MAKYPSNVSFIEPMNQIIDEKNPFKVGNIITNKGTHINRMEVIRCYKKTHSPEDDGARLFQKTVTVAVTK